MQMDTKQADPLSPEVLDVLRSLISALRAVKLYPSNNPVYSQSITKAFKDLERFLSTASEYSITVQKNFFTHRGSPVGKDGELNRTLAQDLFAKGIREVVFLPGLREGELLDFSQALALPPEELALRSGISSILWEKGAEHIKVSEAGLDDVISRKKERDQEKAAVAADATQNELTEKEKIASTGRTLVLGDLMSDPSGFGAKMLDLAKKTHAPEETVEERLFTLYQEAGRKIQVEQPNQSDILFQGLADSALTIESPFREGLIAGKLYGDLDAEISGDQDAVSEEHLPSPIHELQTGRFSSAWNTNQVATLLKKASSKKSSPPAPLTTPAEITVIPLLPGLADLAKQLPEYSPEELATLEMVSHSGMESDIIEASVRTLLSLLNMVKNPHRAGATPSKKEVELFSGVVHQLEDLLIYLLKKKDYNFGGLIIEAFHHPVDPRSSLA